MIGHAGTASLDLLRVEAPVIPEVLRPTGGAVLDATPALLAAPRRDPG